MTKDWGIQQFWYPPQHLICLWKKSHYIALKDRHSKDRPRTIVLAFVELKLMTQIFLSKNHNNIYFPFLSIWRTKSFFSISPLFYFSLSLIHLPHMFFPFSVMLTHGNQMLGGDLWVILTTLQVVSGPLNSCVTKGDFSLHKGRLEISMYK